MGGGAGRELLRSSDLKIPRTQFLAISPSVIGIDGGGEAGILALLGFRPVAMNSVVFSSPRFSTFINKNVLWVN